MDLAVTHILDAPAQQQPEWVDGPPVEHVRKLLHDQPGLVDGTSVRALHAALAEVAAGRLHVIQAGDCAEHLDESTAEQVVRKVSLLDLLAMTMKLHGGKPVLRVGRIAGQFGKPRSQPYEQVGGQTLPVFRGSMVNTPEPSAAGRAPNPDRMLAAYDAAADVMHHLSRYDRALPGDDDPAHASRVWTSHEALVLDYELPLVRRDEHGRLLLSSTHWPWVGERTRQVDGAHVDLLSSVVNPVASKVGPKATPEEIVRLAERLDPDRVPGRLTLIARFGADRVEELLPPIAEAVRAAGHPVIWLSDPVHANTVTTPEGAKTRFVDTVIAEIEGFQRAVHAAGAVAGGLHLETTPEPVTECVQDETEIAAVDDEASAYTSLCDPRLNPTQAVAAAGAWRG